MSLLTESTPDSARFGLRVLRGRIDDAPSKQLAAEILSNGCDVAIIRVPTARSRNLEGLARWAFPVIHADTLVYYRCELDRYSPHPVRNAELAFTPAEADDIESLRQLIARTFDGYKSHYHANPEFSETSILAGYMEWAENHLHADNHSLWTLRNASGLLAFAACKEEPDSGEAEGVLYGVSPGAAGSGLYGDLIRRTQAHFKARGYSRMKVSTQVGNFAVQKVWVREGFSMYEAFDTFHVNAMLSTGRLRIDGDLTFSGEQVDAFAALSGDRNPIHLDDIAANAVGFDGRISHGMLAAAELSRIFGMDFPGPGTLYLRSDTAFLKPVYAAKRHRLRIRSRDVAGRPGHMKAVSTIHDGNGDLCLVDYSDLLLRNH